MQMHFSDGGKFKSSRKYMKENVRRPSSPKTTPFRYVLQSYRIITYNKYKHSL